MDKKTIGILGGTGYVGREAVNTILNFTDYNIMLGGRNPDKLRQNFQEMGSRGNFLPVDVYNKDLLYDFCSKCDIVINCAGPSKQILDIVASAAIENCTHYVDVSGGEHLYRQLMQRSQEIEKKQLLFIIAAGVYPGLSELFPAYAAEKYFDDIDLLELFFAGQGEFSLNAAYDIVCSIEDDNGSGMTYCQNGEVKKVNGTFYRNYKLPYPAGQLDTYPILNPEFQRIAKRYKFKSAYFYNTYQNKSVLNKFVMIKALEQYKTEEQKRASAKILAEQFGAKKKAINDFNMFHLIAKGKKNGKDVQLVLNLLSKNNWNALSGIIAANVARLVIEENSQRSGCFFVAEGVNVTKLMDVLSEQNIYLKHTFT